jgi:hypothetical protein
MGFREDIVRYADTNWGQVCSDQVVYVRGGGGASYVDANGKLSISSCLSHFKKTSPLWWPVFLDYDTTYRGKPRRSEGLFLIEMSKVSIALDTWSYQEPALSTAIPVATFHDVPSDEEPLMPAGTRPGPYGLNDCTHFTSQCLLAGGLSSSLASIDAREFFDKLYASSATKSLARIVPRAQAVPIIGATTSPFKKGDVLIYSDSSGNCSHAVIHLGGGRIAQHSLSLHPNHPKLGANASWTKLHNDSDHSHVTLYHLNGDDPTGAIPWLSGWWNVSGGGATRYYYFDYAKGTVAYVTAVPSTTAAPASPTDRGYWFDEGTSFSACWRSMGDFERFSFTKGTSPASVTGTRVSGVTGTTTVVATKR